MDDFEELEENYRRTVEKMNEAINKIAENLSSNIRKEKNKNDRLTLLKNLKKVPTNQVLNRVNEIAIEKEDYETCDAIKEYCEFKGIDISKK